MLMINPQIILSNGLPQYAVLSYQDYLTLLAKSEEYDDVEDYLDYKKAEQIALENKEWLSHQDVKKLLELDK